ncbi:hypothetical protein KPL71_023070 [Citrus sinensis]|uniref:Uncharacterized protein n=1 Tax=Citrus sinensis TaxID=2711 RepID=A0ACB8IGX0_CITSI|nr:hypothetical protein KPL71_023070 [Citrus sinensis]
MCIARVKKKAIFNYKTIAVIHGRWNGTVVDNACADLNLVVDENGCTTSSPTLKAASLVPMQSCQRKRKHGATTGSSEGHCEITGLSMKEPKNNLASPTSLKIAALEALETLLIVAGDLGSASWRPTVDLLLINLATDYKRHGAMRRIVLPCLMIQLALEFSAKVKFFRRRQASRELAGFCAGALLALEVLIHPRFLPLGCFPHRFPENVLSGGQKQNTTYFNGMRGAGHGAPDSFDDELYETWFGDGNPSEISVLGPGENVDTREKISAAGSSGAKVSERNSKKQADDGVRNNEDEVMVESQQFQELPSSKGGIDFRLTGDQKLPQRKLEVAAPDGCLHDKSPQETASGEDFLAEKHSVSKKPKMLPQRHILRKAI